MQIWLRMLRSRRCDCSSGGRRKDYAIGSGKQLAHAHSEEWAEEVAFLVAGSSSVALRYARPWAGICG